MDLEFSGEHLVLLAERAVFWPRRATLFVADLHLGKDASFRKHGIPVPQGIGREDLERLSDILRQVNAGRLVFLGDLVHASSGLTPSTIGTVAGWRSGQPDLHIVLVRGNHDRSAGDPPPEWKIECVSEPEEDPPFLLHHAPPERANPFPALAGHLHPAVTLVGAANTHMTLPCFWMRANTLVLPAFTGFSGRPRIAPEVGDRFFVAGEGQVVEAACFE